MKILLLLSAVIGLTAHQSMAAEDKESKETKKIVFLTGDDLNHPSGTHEFYAGGVLLKNSLKQSIFKDQLEIEVVNNWPEETSVFEDADLIVHYYAGGKFHPLNENHEFIGSLVEKGVSQMFMHYAVDPNNEAEGALTRWLGAVYKTGKSANPHWLLKSQLEKHSINNGVKSYESYDEWYCCMQFEDSVEINYEKEGIPEKTYSVMSGTAEEFLKAKRLKPAFNRELSDQELIVLWAKESDSGARGVGLTGGHYHKNWANDEFRKQVLNAIIWSAKIPVPDSGVESPKISEEEINANLAVRKNKQPRKISL